MMNNGMVTVEIRVQNNLSSQPIFVKIESDSKQDLSIAQTLAEPPTKEALQFQNSASYSIAPSQSYLFPVSVHRKFHIALVTVWVRHSKTAEYVQICNKCPINAKSISVTREPQKGNVIIAPKNEDNKVWTKGLPQYLSGSMHNCGWNKEYLNEISRRDLSEMGFKSGHSITFFDEYYRNIADKESLNYETMRLLQEWNIPMFACVNMIERGWTDPQHWQCITDKQFGEMGFKDGHIASFRRNMNKICK